MPKPSFEELLRAVNTYQRNTRKSFRRGAEVEEILDKILDEQNTFKRWCEEHGLELDWTIKID